MCVRVHGSFDIDTRGFSWVECVPHVSDELATVVSRIGASYDGFLRSRRFWLMFSARLTFNQSWLAFHLSSINSEGKIRCSWRRRLFGLLAG
jgi:hypothetical protein